MKKILILLIIMSLGTLDVYATKTKNEYCTYNQIQEKLEALKDVTLNYTVMTEGTVYVNPRTFDEIDVSDKVKIEIEGLPSGFYALLENGNFQEFFDSGVAIVDGGVYEISYYNYDCGVDVIKSYEVMVPYYNPSNKDDAWFDGTYETSASDYEELPPKASTILIVVLALLVTLIIGFIVFIIIKRRKSKYENQF